MKSTIVLGALAILFFAFAPAAQCAEKNPGELVREFYDWYIEGMEKWRHLPEEDEGIYAYVYPCTVNRLRLDLKKGLVDANYFLCTNDFDYEYYKKFTKIYKTIPINDSVALVPVGGDEPYLVVYVQKTEKGWRIIKVEDILFGY